MIARPGPWLAPVLVLGLSGCEADQPPMPLAGESASGSPALDSVHPTATSAGLAISVVEVVQLPASEMGQRVFAVLLEGGAGTSAVRRSLEITAWTEPVTGSSCTQPSVPSVLRPIHPDAVKPHLADQTRTVVVGSLGGQPEPGGDSQPPARFRYGPVPSLNGDFSGWVSFGFPASHEDGFCAFDVRGVVRLVAGGTTTAELPVLRIDTRDGLDGERESE